MLGFAHGHAATYCERWRAHPEWGARVVAGWDPDPARLADAAAKCGVESCASAAALLARPDLEAVLIAAETAFHAEPVEQAAFAGKAIILQKPLCLTLEEADRIVAAVRRHGVPFTLAWQMRVDPHNVRARELLASGRFGKVFMARRRHCLNTHDWPAFDRSWHVRPELNRDIFMDHQRPARDQGAGGSHQGPGRAARRFSERTPAAHRCRRRRARCPAPDVGMCRIERRRPAY